MAMCDEQRSREMEARLRRNGVSACGRGSAIGSSGSSGIGE